MRLDGVDHPGDDHGEDDVPSGGMIIYISISTNKRRYDSRYTPIEVSTLRDGAGHNGSTGRGEGALL